MFLKVIMRASFTWKNNMADETKESCSFHEMGLDDRLVKVKVILVNHINTKYSV